MTLRDSFLAAVKATQQKTLVCKSPVAPPIACIRDKATGRILGYGPVERVPPDEVARLVKMDVSKSADDLNAVFDSLFEFRPDFQPSQADVSKSADLSDDLNPELVGIFPTWLQPTQQR